MTRKLPLFYFTPTLCWVDDNELFIESANSLFKENYESKLFLNPEEAIQFLNSYQTPTSQINFTREYIENELYDTHNHIPLDINIGEIAKLNELTSKINEIAILIIDNNMPNVTGIEICHRLKNEPYKKILLTGETHLKEVINSFNDGIIDRYIAKDQFVSENLKKNIQELSYQYFYEKTKNLLAHIEIARPSPLSDPVFIDFFYHWFEKNNFNEFYLINKSGSFLLKDKNGISTYFVVMSEYAKNEFLKLNDDASESIQDLLLSLSQGKSIPFFGIEKDYWEYNYCDWRKYFFPANTLQGRENYYWASISAKEI